MILPYFNKNNPAFFLFKAKYPPNTTMPYLILLLSLILCLPLQAQEIDKGSLLQDLQTLSADDMEGRKAGTAGGEKARNFLIGRFKEIGLLSFEGGYEQYFGFNTFRNNERYENCVNLIGYIPGQSSDAIVISAHYDHLGIANGEIYNGADDNASGTAALLAMAEYFSKNKPKHTLIFAAFDAEEQGKKGAIYWVAKPHVPLSQVVLNINMDMISQNDKNELWASGTYHFPFLKPLIEEVEVPQGLNLRFGHDRPEQGADDWTNSSDHSAFFKEGIPFVYFGVEDHPRYHKPSDTFEAVQPDFYFKAASFVLEAIRHLDGVDLRTARN
jgi:Zn-dependent M28 family amino/carboxypeptidase